MYGRGGGGGLWVRRWCGGGGWGGGGGGVGGGGGGGGGGRLGVRRQCTWGVGLGGSLHETSATFPILMIEGRG